MGKKILIIDDDHDLSDTVKSVLEYAGYEALVSYAPQEGMSMAKKQKPDLILMDVMMPGMNGAEAVKALNSDPITGDIPVIFLTALVSDFDKEAGYEGLNVDGSQYLTLAKPFKNDELLKEIKAALQ